MIQDKNSHSDKSITIKGKNNRYQVKKHVFKDNDKKEKINNGEIIESNYNYDNQIFILNEYIANYSLTNINHKLLNAAISKKLSSYKQQDIMKKRHIPDIFITLNDILLLLQKSILKCNYCLKNVFIFYKNVREPSQWTLDRIDNDLGHNKDNVVISCLSCNLKRRTTNKDKFDFTKKMVIVKNDY